MLENENLKDNSTITKDYDFFVNCNQDDLSKFYADIIKKENKLHKKMQDITKEIKQELQEVIKEKEFIIKAIYQTYKKQYKNKDKENEQETNLREKIIKEKKENNLIPFLESDSYKEAMQFKETLSQDEQQKIINEVNKEMNMSYEND